MTTAFLEGNQGLWKRKRSELFSTKGAKKFSICGKKIPLFLADVHLLFLKGLKIVYYLFPIWHDSCGLFSLLKYQILGEHRYP
jgi:hypothetical protein